jgi:hypothetical protein
MRVLPGAYLRVSRVLLEGSRVRPLLGYDADALLDLSKSYLRVSRHHHCDQNRAKSGNCHLHPIRMRDQENPHCVLESLKAAARL